MGLDGESDEFISLEVGGDVGGVWASEEYIMSMCRDTSARSLNHAA